MEGKRTGAEVLSEAAKAWLDVHSAEKFSLETMAGALYVNGSYLLRAFKSCTGMTPLAYHHHIRCEKAKEMLVSSDRSISQIGDAVGFVSSSHFSHIFRKTVGCTPGDYRKSARTSADVVDEEPGI